jgi:hypothetical protein
MIIALLGIFLALPAVTALPASAEPAGRVPAKDLGGNLAADRAENLTGNPAGNLAAQPTPTAPTGPSSPGGTAPSGPKLQPDTEADEAESRRKLIMGATSVVLLGIVIWGRSIRRKRKKAAEGG